MTYGKVKNMLQNVKGKRSRLKALEGYIREERAFLEGISAVRYDKVTVDCSPGNSNEERFTRYMDRLNELEKRFDMLMEDMNNEEKLIDTLMQKLTPTEYEVILNRYLRGLSRAKTARLMKYSPDNIKYLQTQAIKKMSK